MPGLIWLNSCALTICSLSISKYDFMYKCSFKYFVCCSTLLNDAVDDAEDDAVDGERDGVSDFVEFKDVEEAAEEWLEILAELHREGRDFSCPMIWLNLQKRKKFRKKLIINSNLWSNHHYCC